MSGSGDLVTPWVVETDRADGIDYNKLIEKFGCSSITDVMTERLRKAIDTDVHTFLCRAIFYSHREFDEIISCVEKRSPFFLYTGRGPSSEAMHCGHMVPFIFTKWLQEVFSVPLVIQLTDDEKYFWKDMSLAAARRLAFENARDIISMGFDSNDTLIFNDLDFISRYPPFNYMIARLQKAVAFRDIKMLLDLNESDNIGRIAHAGVKLAAVFATYSLPCLFNESTTPSPAMLTPEPLSSFKGAAGGLVVFLKNGPAVNSTPHIDDGSLFLLGREIANQLHLPVPTLLGLKPLPSLLEVNSPMNPTVTNSAIFLSDTKNVIKKKINKYAFSGGGATVEDHLLHGGNCEVDVACHMLRYFLWDDAELEMIEQEYKSGKLLTGSLKKKLIDILTECLGSIQDKRISLESQRNEVLQRYLVPLPDKQSMRTMLADSTLDNFLAHVDSICQSDICHIMEEQVLEEATVVDWGKFFNCETCTVSPLLRRGLVHGYCGIEKFIENCKNQGYIVCSHRPTSNRLHLGEVVLFQLLKWLQDQLNIRLIIHVTDDEQFLTDKNIETASSGKAHQMAHDNILDIVAIGFSSNNTTVFSSYDIMTEFYAEVTEVQHRVTFSTVRSIFGFTDSFCIGQIGFPAVQAVTSFSGCFPDLLSHVLDLEKISVAHNKHKPACKTKDFDRTPCIPCLIPCAIDQDPFFRMIRDVAPRMGQFKPSIVHSKFFPALGGINSKMSASVKNSAIFINDSASEVERKILTETFTSPTLPERDVSLQYLFYFLDDQVEYDKTYADYSSGRLDATDIKTKLIELLSRLLQKVQKHRREIQQNVLFDFFLRHRSFR